jgi:HAD superfamily hydrolase (TIGR01549 family)
MTINTVLFDMDSTIVSIDESGFTKNYFGFLHKHYFKEFDLEFFSDALIEVTRTVMLSDIPEELTFDTFMREMADCYNLPKEEIKKRFLKYYDKEYNKLSKYIKPTKGAKEAIELCFEQGLDVVVATTPVFIEKAILKRLQWGKVHNYDYKLITHAENMHYSKPRKEYYLELLEMIGKKPNECIMVGNEFMGDIVGPSRIHSLGFFPIISNNSR